MSNWKGLCEVSCNDVNSHASYDHLKSVSVVLLPFWGYGEK